MNYISNDHQSVWSWSWDNKDCFQLDSGDSLYMYENSVWSVTLAVGQVWSFVML